MSPDEIAELRRLLGEKGAWANVDLIQASVAALPKLLDALEAAQAMISCEGTERECAKDAPNPPGVLLSRCFSCQWTVMNGENARLRAIAEAARNVRDHHTTDAASIQCDALRAALAAYDAGGTE